jgi:DNA-binding MarR family transcriptional regulator
MSILAALRRLPTSKAGNIADQTCEAVMINQSNIVGQPRVESDADSLRRLYHETLQLVERLHRRLQDVVKDEFDRSGRDDINAVQAILLFNIGDSELTAGELRSRGYYLGSNVSYNVKKLAQDGFIHHKKSKADKRSVRISLTEKGREVADAVADLYERHIVSIEAVGGIDADEFNRMNRAMQRLDRFWNDTILYRL